MDRLYTTELLAALHEDESSPWVRYRPGRSDPALNAIDLAQILSRHEIAPRKMRNGRGTARGLPPQRLHRRMEAPRQPVPAPPSFLPQQAGTAGNRRNAPNGPRTPSTHTTTDAAHEAIDRFIHSRRNRVGQWQPPWRRSGADQLRHATVLSRFDDIGQPPLTRDLADEIAQRIATHLNRASDDPWLDSKAAAEHWASHRTRCCAASCGPICCR